MQLVEKELSSKAAFDLGARKISVFRCQAIKEPDKPQHVLVKIAEVNLSAASCGMNVVVRQYEVSMSVSMPAARSSPSGGFGRSPEETRLGSEGYRTRPQDCDFEASQVTEMKFIP